MPSRPRRSTVRFAFALAALVAAAPVLPHDLNPPVYRGALLSTSAEWDFDTDQPANNIQPDGDTVPLAVGDVAPDLDAAFPVGAPYPSCSRFGDVTWTNLGGDGGYQGGPMGNGVLACNTPNWEDTEPEKQLRIQLTYTGPAPPTAVFGFLGVPGSSTGVTEFFARRVPDTDPSLPPGALYLYDEYRLFPNPDWEQVVVYLPNGTRLTQMVVDTVSGPMSDLAPIFADGFETGDTSRWSAAVP